MKKLSLLFCLLSLAGYAQSTKSVLFLGNSYTYYNDLPGQLSDIASSKGDVLIRDQNTPGGKSLSGHTNDLVSIDKIKQGGWDFVVLQDQSQRPSLSPNSVATNSLRYAEELSDTIYKYSPCGQPLFFMTWGRKNGDASNCASYPPVCTYAGMQARLRSSYIIMGQENNAPVSPVGAVWRDFRSTNPTVELYSPDESHPSLNGSYLAACTFYASIYHKSPMGAWKPAAMTSNVALSIQTQAHNTVFDSLSVWRIDTAVVPPSGTSYINRSTSSTQTDFAFYAADSLRLDSVIWNFGNGTNALGFSVIGSYTASGSYEVVSEHWKKCVRSVDTLIIPFFSQSIGEDAANTFSIYPNPSTGKVSVETYLNGIIRYNLYSLDGKHIKNGVVENESIDISDLISGEYILLLEVNDQFFRQKIWKK